MAFIPDDPVVRNILGSGEFDGILRSGKAGEGVLAIAGFLIGRYKGMTPSGAQWLAGQVIGARTAGSVLASLEPGQAMPMDAIPIIPGIAGPSLIGGRVAVIAHDIYDIEPGEPLQGWDYAGIFIDDPTLQKLYEYSIFARANSWETMRGGQGDDPLLAESPTTTVIYGVYRSY